jgi:hypothetical protein
LHEFYNVIFAAKVCFQHIWAGISKEIGPARKESMHPKMSSAYIGLLICFRISSGHLVMFDYQMIHTTKVGTKSVFGQIHGVLCSARCFSMKPQI